MPSPADNVLRRVEGRRGSRLPLLQLLMLWLPLLVLATAPLAVAQVEPEPAAVPEPPASVAPAAPAAPPAPEAEEGVRAEVDRLFRVLRLRNGVLLEPREDMNGIAAIEIDGSTFVVDGAPVASEDLDALLGGPAADVVRRLSRLEARARPETFGGEERRGARRPPPPPDAPPPPDRTDRSRFRSRTDSQVVVGNSLTIEADEESRDVVVFGGSLTIRGQVVGDAVSIGGPVRLEKGGVVTGDLVAVGGSATLEADTEVQGDAISVGNKVQMDDSAVVGGKVVEVPFGPNVSFGWPDFDGWDLDWDDDWWEGHSRGIWGLGRIFGLFWDFFALILLALLACLAYLLAHGPVERMARKVRSEAWKAGLVGLVAQILFLPLLVIVCVILVISLIGIPLLLLVPFAVLAVVVVSFLGYSAVAYAIGKWTERRFGWKMVSPYVAIVVGVGFIEVFSFVADVLDFLPGPLWLFVFMFAVAGGLIGYASWTVGLGAALLTRFGTIDDYMAGSPAPLPPIPGTAGTAQSPETVDALGPPADLDWESSGDGVSGDSEQPWQPESPTNEPGPGDEGPSR